MSAQSNFEETFPAITEWIGGQGWIEIGQTEDSSSFIRAIDTGGLVWEGKQEYKSVDNALRALERALAMWIKENG